MPSRHLRSLLFLLAIFAPAGFASAQPDSHQVSIPVLCYHRFADHYKDDYAVTPAEFKRQLEIIREEGFTPITAGHLAEGLAGRVTLPAKPLVISADDGYKDFVTHAKPMLDSFGFPATFFVYANFVNSKNGVTRDQLAMLQQAGYEIGSHSTSHPHLSRYPAEWPEARKQKALRDELVASRAKLQEWSGGPVSTLAYPYGLWDREVAEVAAAAGYEAQFTVNPGPNPRNQPRTSLNRIMIMRGTRDKTFRAMLRDRAFEVEAWHPGLGERVKGPLTEVSLTLTPDTMAIIDPASLKLQCGSQTLELTAHPSTGEVRGTFGKPLERGTQLLVLTAKDAKRQNTFKTSWLVIVDK